MPAEKLYAAIGRFLWRCMLLAVVVLAVYVSGTRALLRTLPLYEAQVLAWLSGQTNLQFEAGKLTGDIASFKPVIQSDGLRLFLPDGTPIQFSRATVSIDPWTTLLDRQIRLDTLQLQGLGLALPLASLRRQNSGPTPGFEQAVGLLSAFRSVSVVDAELTLQGGGSEAVLQLSVELRRSGSERQLRVKATGPGETELTMSGTGVGDLSRLRRVSGDFHGKFEWQDLAWLSDLSGIPFNARGDLDVWYDNDGIQPRFVLSGAVENMWLQSDASVRTGLDSVSLSVQLLPNDDGWVGQIEELLLTAGEYKLPLARLDLSSDDGGLKLSAADLDVAVLAGLLTTSNIVSGKPGLIVGELAPSGTVAALEASVADISEPWKAWSVSGEVQDLSVQPRGDVPGLLGMDATIEGTQAGATAWIDTEDFTLDLPKVYSDPIRFQRVLGRLSAAWSPAMLYLHSGVLRAEHEKHDAQVLLGMDIPVDRASADAEPLSMQLDVGVAQADTALWQVYVPYRIPPKLSSWLVESDLAGGLSALQFSWRGGFKDFGSGKQSLQLGATLEAVDLRFQEDWPAVEAVAGTLLIDTDRVSVWADQGTIGQIPFQDTGVEVDASPALDSIQVDGRFQGASNDALALLRNSPIYGLAGAVLDDFTMDGPLAGELDLDLSLRAPAVKPKVAVAIQLEGASLASEVLQLELADLSGNLSYDLEQGFLGNGLAATLFSEPVNIAITPGSSGLDDANVLDGRFTFNVAGDRLWQWGQSLSGALPPGSKSPPLLGGLAGIEVALAVGTGARAMVRTTLEGMSVALPEPLGKSAEQSTPVAIAIDTNPEAPWKVFWSGRAQADLQRHSGLMDGILLDVTPRLEATELPDLDLDGVLKVIGRLDRIEVDPWLAALGALPRRDPGSQPTWFTDITELTIDELVVGTIAMEEVRVDLTPYADWDRLGINTGWLDAELTLPRDDRKIVLVINALDYDQFANLRTVETDLDSPEPTTAERRPPALPVPVDVALANFTYRGKPQGAARFTLSSASDAMVISDIQGQLAGLKLGNDSGLTWSADEDGEWFTRLQLNGTVEDVAGTFDSLSLEPLARTQSGQLAADLFWPDGPADIDLQNLTGTANIDLRNGSFLPVSSSATGAVRLLGLLNLAGLFGRADVTRIFDPGVAFRTAGGELQFRPGAVAVPGFDIRGPGGGFNFHSDIDLTSETMEGELVVTLPLVENIPWMAALVGGLPVAAGAYLVSKLFESQVKQLSSGVYSVRGNISSPEVTFERIFDASSSLASGDPLPEAVEKPVENESEASSAQPESSPDGVPASLPPSVSSSSRK